MSLLLRHHHTVIALILNPTTVGTEFLTSLTSCFTAEKYKALIE